MALSANTTPLGDKPINRIGYGAMQLTGPGVFGPPRDPAAARAVLRRAIALGVDHIDTSQYYGPDVVNDQIRQALHPYPENLKIPGTGSIAHLEENMAAIGLELDAEDLLALELAVKLVRLSDARRRGAA